MGSLIVTGVRSTGSRRGRRKPGVSLPGQLTKQRSLRLALTGWKTMSASVDVLLLTLGGIHVFVSGQHDLTVLL